MNIHIIIYVLSDDYNITPNSYEDFFTQFNTMGVLSQADKAQIAFLVLCFDIRVTFILQTITYSRSRCKIIKHDNEIHEKQLVYHQI